MSADNEDVEVPIENNVIVETVKETDESMQKPKVKKPRSEKQIEALKKAHAVRQANFAEKKRLIQLEKEERESRMQQIKENEEQADDEEDEEDEAPVVKPKPKAKPKKKVKKTSKIVFEDEDSEEEQEIIIRKVRKNKKVEKVVEPTPRPTSPINIPIPKENKKMTSISEVEENIVEENTKRYSHSEILKMMGM